MAERLIVVVEEKVVVKERLQMLVLEGTTVLVLVALRELRFVKQRAFHFH